MEIIEKIWTQDEILDRLAKAKNKKSILADLKKDSKNIDATISNWEARLK